MVLSSAKEQLIWDIQHVLVLMQRNIFLFVLKVPNVCTKHTLFGSFEMSTRCKNISFMHTFKTLLVSRILIKWWIYMFLYCLAPINSNQSFITKICICIFGSQNILNMQLLKWASRHIEKFIWPRFGL